VHRIGRTGRAGKTGQAISLVSADEAKQLFDIERLIQQKLERVLIDDFVPEHNVPESGKKILPVKTKKPKKPKPRSKPRYGKNSASAEDKTKKPKNFWGKKKS
jgi:ATP-dependent RNA helicase RhlE